MRSKHPGSGPSNGPKTPHRRSSSQRWSVTARVCPPHTRRTATYTAPGAPQTIQVFRLFSSVCKNMVFDTFLHVNTSKNLLFNGFVCSMGHQLYVHAWPTVTCKVPSASFVTKSANTWQVFCPITHHVEQMLFKVHIDFSLSLSPSIYIIQSVLRRSGTHG